MQASASPKSRRFGRVWASGPALYLHAKAMREALAKDEARRRTSFGLDAERQRAACVLVAAPQKPGDVERLAVEAGMLVEPITAQPLAVVAPEQEWAHNPDIDDTEAYHAKLRANAAQPEAYGPSVAILALRGTNLADAHVVLLTGRLSDFHHAYPDRETRGILNDAGVSLPKKSPVLLQAENAGASQPGGQRFDEGAQCDPKRRA